MRVALKAVNGVENVEVSLNRGNAVVTMKPGNNVSFRDIQRAITKNGFVVNDTKVEVSGQILRSNGQLAVQVTGTNDNYSVSFDKPDLQKSVEPVGRKMRLSGTLPPAKPGKMPDMMMVSAVKDENAR